MKKAPGIGALLWAAGPLASWWVAPALVAVLRLSASAAQQQVGPSELINPSAVRVVTAAELAGLKARLSGLLPSVEPARRVLLGGLVRLAFHDAGTFDPADPLATRANGCVNLDSQANAGLDRIIETLSPVCDGALVSRADCWQLAANAATEAASSTPLSIPFRVGRVDLGASQSLCADGSAFARALNLPNAERSLEHTSAVFVARMGFTEREVTALMGAHTLGRADLGDSGYDGEWTAAASSFDNQYYRDMVDIPWGRSPPAL